MSKQESKQSFLGGAAILTAAVIIVKIIGAVYLIPLNNILGSEGKTYFRGAYNIYNVLMAFSVGGFPLAISKLTSEAQALGRENEKRRLFRTALWLFLGLGLFGSLLMFFGAGQLAAFVNEPHSYWPIKALAPAVFCVCLLACMRGYTQGQGNMSPTAVSQVLEALGKLLMGLPLAWYLLQQGRGMAGGATGAILGISASEVLALLYLFFYLTRHPSRRKTTDVPASRKTLLGRVMALGIPITLSGSAMSIISLIDMKIVLGRLQSIPSLADSAAALYGQYSFSLDLFNLSPSFVFPVTMSLIPSVADAVAQRNDRRADRIVSSAFRLVALLALPAGVGLSVLSDPILLLLYPAQRADAIAAGPHLQVLGIASIFVCLMLLTNAILQSYGKQMIPIYTMVAGGLVKIGMNYVLVGNPDINIHGAPLSTLLCYLTISALNLFFVYRTLQEKPHYLALFFKPVLASAVMGVAVHYAFRLLSGPFGNTLSTLGSIVAGVAVYLFLVLALRILRAEDVRNVRKGDVLIKILHLK
jgi:stage V sporulation protein B